MFSDLIDMLDHKRDYCKLRFTCKCDVLNEECTSCDLSTSELMNINCNQGSQGDTNSVGDASINMSSSSRNLTSEASTINSPISLPGKGNQKSNTFQYVGLNYSLCILSQFQSIWIVYETNVRILYLLSINVKFLACWNILYHLPSSDMLFSFLYEVYATKNDKISFFYIDV